uniref:Retrotransposon gag domain-containing protein n=1 Tax=Amphiprion percula TaxID=161767 RepID=A0A3P8TGN2_AMPPE
MAVVCDRKREEGVFVSHACASSTNSSDSIEMLKNLSSSNSAMYKQLSSLTERVNQLAARPPASAPIANPVSPITPVKEPHVPVPERYSGDFGSCQAFLTQVSLVFDLQPHSYPTDKARVAFLVSLLSGDARDWGTAVWRQQGPLCHSYAAFVDEMQRNFDHPVRGRDASTRLMNIQQGTRSVAEYALEFRTLAAEASWNDEALWGSFYNGLNETLKDELAMREEPSTLEQWISCAIKLDNRLRERRREKGVRSVSAFPGHRPTP